MERKGHVRSTLLALPYGQRQIYSCDLLHCPLLWDFLFVETHIVFITQATQSAAALTLSF